VLRSLSVRNLAVLAGGEIELGPGFNVLTGETGAGKSLLVDSLALLAGGRAASDLVREGAESLTVAGIFDCDAELAARLADAGFELDDNEVVVRREISREGRNRVFVNDRPATARLLQDLAPALLRVHGQREELGLAEPALQRAWLDRVGGAAAAELRARVAALFHDYRNWADRLDSLSGDERLRAERLDLLAFQARELDEARPIAGEEEELRRERDALRHHEAIAEGLGAAESALAGEETSAVGLVHAARRALAGIRDWEPLAVELEGELGELEVRLNEAARSVATRLGGLDTDPRRLDEVESRLALLERLMRKYGLDAAGLAFRRQEIARELAALTGGEGDREAVAAGAAAALAAYRQAATELSQARAAWGAELERRVGRELADLALAKARLTVGLERDRREGSALVVGGEPVEFGAEGFDHVVFGFAPNPGEPLLPLVRIASGGELARVALALQLATRGDEVPGGPTLIFDEIDAGLGGAEGAAIGRKLKRLARRGQIVAVTHLPQVASFGDRHYSVHKRQRGGRSHAEVEPLDRAARVEEIARMLSADEITPASRRHAGELLAAAAGERG
jgi:DNA repair protein RecN (Recombination protein N)